MAPPEDWSIHALGDLVHPRSGSTPTRSRPELWDGNTPWVGPADLYARTVSSSPESLTPEGLRQAAPLAVPDEVLVVVRSMALGKRLFFAQVRDRPIAFNQDIKALRVRDRVLACYLPHLLWGHHDVLHGLVDEASHGTKRLRSEVLFGQELAVPPPAEQRAIASILGVLDDKIESNRRLGTSLHALLPALFDACIAQTTRKITLGDLGRVVGGGTPSSSEPTFWAPDEVAWITPKDMTALNDTPVIARGARHISRAGLDSSSAKLVPAGTVVYTSRATLGVIAVTQEPMATNQGFISVLPNERYGSAFVYCTLACLRDQINAKANGSTFMEVNKTNFKAVTCPLPERERLRQFRQRAEPVFDQVGALSRESRTLTAIRDALLPKLVSGQIRLPVTQ